MKRCSPTNPKPTAQYISHSYLKQIILSKTSIAQAQAAFIYLNLTIITVEKSVKYVQS